MNSLPVSKFPLHEFFCFKNIFKCHCGEIINIDDKEEHFKDKHNCKNCQYCNEKYEPQQLKCHEELCSYKPNICKYCGLHLHKEELDHEEFCGSRTQKCENCEKYILIKNFDNHIDCQKESEEEYDFNMHLALYKKSKSRYKGGTISLVNKMGLLHSKSQNYNNDNNKQKLESFSFENNNSHKQSSKKKHLIKTILPKKNDDLLISKYEQIRRDQENSNKNHMPLVKTSHLNVKNIEKKNEKKTSGYKKDEKYPMEKKIIKINNPFVYLKYKDDFIP